MPFVQRQPIDNHGCNLEFTATGIIPGQFHSLKSDLNRFGIPCEIIPSDARDNRTTIKVYIHDEASLQKLGEALSVKDKMADIIQENRDINARLAENSEEWDQFVQHLKALQDSAYKKVIGDDGVKEAHWKWMLLMEDRKDKFRENVPREESQEYVGFHVLIGSTPNRECAPLMDLSGEWSTERFYKDIIEDKVEIPQDYSLFEKRFKRPVAEQYETAARAFEETPPKEEAPSKSFRERAGQRIKKGLTSLASSLRIK